MTSIRFILGWSIGLFLAGCGGSTVIVGSGTEGGTPGTCSLSAGTYTQHATAEAGGTNCATLPDETSTFNGNETFTAGVGSRPADGGLGCTTNVDTSTCTLTTSCLLTSSGFTTMISSTLTLNEDSATGKETLKSTDATGRVLSTCTYDITMTKS